MPTSLHFCSNHSSLRTLLNARFTFRFPFANPLPLPPRLDAQATKFQHRFNQCAPACHLSRPTTPLFTHLYLQVGEDGTAATLQEVEDYLHLKSIDDASPQPNLDLADAVALQTASTEQVVEWLGYDAETVSATIYNTGL